MSLVSFVLNIVMNLRISTHVCFLHLYFIMPFISNWVSGLKIRSEQNVAIKTWTSPTPSGIGPQPVLPGPAFWLYSLILGLATVMRCLRILNHAVDSPPATPLICMRWCQNNLWRSVAVWAGQCRTWRGQGFLEHGAGSEHLLTASWEEDTHLEKTRWL